MVGDGDYIYVSTEKIYILHLNEQQGTKFTSYAPSPLCVLGDSVFTRREAAVKYAQFYVTPNEAASSLLDKQFRT